jgi:hypothetical protein
VDLGENLTLPCEGPGETNAASKFDPRSVEWVYEGMSGRERRQRDRIRPDGSLALTKLHREDAGVYACTIDTGESRESNHNDKGDFVRTRVKVEVRSKSCGKILFLTVV